MLFNSSFQHYENIHRKIHILSHADDLNASFQNKEELQGYALDYQSCLKWVYIFLKKPVISFQE